MAQPIAQKSSLGSRLYSLGAGAVTASLDTVKPIAQKATAAWDRVREGAPEPVKQWLPPLANIADGALTLAKATAATAVTTGESSWVGGKGLLAGEEITF